MEREERALSAMRKGLHFDPKTNEMSHCFLKVIAVLQHHLKNSTENVIAIHTIVDYTTRYVIVDTPITSPLQ